MSTQPTTDRPTGPARTATVLADGRELVYYDDVLGDSGYVHTTHDPRPLPDRFGPDGYAAGPRMRRDPLTGEWVPMATHRMNRTFLPPASACPLCPADPDAEYADGEIPDTAYDVAVFENRFPSLLAVPGEDESVQDDTVVGEGLWLDAPAAGRCEVICFSSDHDTSFAQLDTRRVRTIVDAWADRTEALAALETTQEVFAFENRGREIGVTLPHPHGQIYAYPYVTPRTEQLLTQATAYHRRTGRSLLRDVLDGELAHGRRVVLTSEHWVAYVPFAARWPVEVHLAPRRDVLDLPSLTDAERDDLARTYLRLLRGLDRFFVDPESDEPIPLPYIAGWSQAPAHDPRREHARLHLKLFSVLRAPGKLKYLAGSESGAGAWVSDTTPETVATRLQELLA
ncbi:galactose-1-phosphate uridylyltransferase [Luteimicrobium subarcticum]|uniref:Galactose-1-phosphate uridylyltransferase n=1 Tax=Luteimicrobium subarcticum TaxID=620910 RepID=A0A2M8WV14_9MICO|nr:galactose-1-phosphate uridylyltransferase [Luteimicrobium subarcticum]PJI94770.1 UDPglucose--hexose-1-phosphate uridylyltransferase [Luteimicrobium subarcticum]